MKTVRIRERSRDGLAFVASDWTLTADFQLASNPLHRPQKIAVTDAARMLKARTGVSTGKVTFTGNWMSGTSDPKRSAARWVITKPAPAPRTERNTASVRQSAIRPLPLAPSETRIDMS